LKKNIMFLIVIMFVLLSTGMVYGKTNIAQKEQAIIILDHNMRLEQALEIVSNLELDQIIFSHVSNFNGRKYTGGYAVRPNVPLDDVVISDYKEQYKAMLNEGIAALQIRVSQIEDNLLKASAEQVLADQKQRLEDFISNDIILIDSIKVSGSKQNIDRLFGNDNFSVNYIQQTDSRRNR